MAQRVGILARGKLLCEATIADLRQRATGERRIEVELAEPANGIASALKELPFVVKVQQEGNELTIVTHSDRDYRSEVGRALAGHGGIVQGMRSVEPTLEEAFITITEEHVQDWARKNDDS